MLDRVSSSMISSLVVTFKPEATEPLKSFWDALMTTRLTSGVLAALSLRSSQRKFCFNQRVVLVCWPKYKGYVVLGHRG